ncbi:uncharacterized protein LOC116014112 isoform X2 [Ipomoea triloba]|uniref:uncharacterized protein LOC116014112 isoform X2 n=1 Tax=Ipomoea triloba TaxID=35885 RepID=UPI00125E90FA|nr:uncharacterized protein LOC116014112 isoform X2 [Ipomoea triloba]
MTGTKKTSLRSVSSNQINHSIMAEQVNNNVNSAGLCLSFRRDQGTIQVIAPHIQISGIYTLAPCFIAVYTEKFKNGAGLLTFICFTSTMQVAMPSESVLYDCRTLSSMHLLLLTSFTLCSKKNSFALGKPSGVRASLNLQISVFRFISKRFTHSAILSR